MAKRKLTQDELKERIEHKVWAALATVEDDLADEFEIDCWDSCLDGKVWNNAVKTVTTMYTDAITFERDCGYEVGRKYKLDVDVAERQRAVELKREIKRLEQELEALA